MQTGIEVRYLPTKRCKECKKAIRSHNKSMICSNCSSKICRDKDKQREYYQKFLERRKLAMEVEN